MFPRHHENSGLVDIQLFSLCVSPPSPPSFPPHLLLLHPKPHLLNYSQTSNSFTTFSHCIVTVHIMLDRLQRG